MFEQRREFGKRNASESASQVPQQPADFNRDRPMYERVRMHDAEIDRLLTTLDAIVANQEAGHAVLDDEREKIRTQEQIAAAYKARH